MRIVVIAIVLAGACARPAAAWDPEERSPRAWQPEPVADAPATSYSAPSGLYLVTEVYVGSVVSTSGNVTTYATETAQRTPGTYARVLETVGTGARSAYDGSSFNGRAAMTDGRSVAGTYYENFVLTPRGFTPVSVVFFQDDEEIARQTARGAVPTPTPRPTLPPATVAPTSTARPSTAPPATPAPTPYVAPRPVVPPAAAPDAPAIVVGLSPQELGDPRGTIEVLRGRAIFLWPRAIADGVPAPVIWWRFLEGDGVILGPAAGDAGVPLRARWDQVTRPGSTWHLTLLVTVATRLGPRDALAEVRVTVRSPALIP